MSELWGPIGAYRWRETPCLTGRVANEADVRAGLAVFYLESPERIGAKPIDLTLPRCAILREELTGPAIPVIIIQAEEAEERTYLGYRFLAGGNGLSTLQELELLAAPDARFGMAAE